MTSNREQTATRRGGPGIAQPPVVLPPAGGSAGPVVAGAEACIINEGADALGRTLSLKYRVKDSNGPLTDLTRKESPAVVFTVPEGHNPGTELEFHLEYEIPGGTGNTQTDKYYGRV